MTVSPTATRTVPSTSTPKRVTAVAGEPESSSIFCPSVGSIAYAAGESSLILLHPPLP